MAEESLPIENATIPTEKGVGNASAQGKHNIPAQLPEELSTKIAWKNGVTSTCNPLMAAYRVECGDGLDDQEDLFSHLYNPFSTQRHHLLMIRGLLLNESTDS